MGEPSAGSGRRALAVTGVDGCARGWIAVTLTFTGGPPAARPADAAARGSAGLPGVARADVVAGVTVAATLDGLPLARVTGIDMPLGLLGAG